MAHPVERFIIGLEISVRFGDDFLVGVESLSLEHFFEVCKQIVVAGGSVRRTWT